MTDKDGPIQDDKAAPEADRQAVAAAMLNSAEWQEKLAAARESRAKVLAARTSDPEEKLKAALARTASGQTARAQSPQAPTPVQSAAPSVAAPPNAPPPPAEASADEPPELVSALQPRRRAPSFLIGLLIGLCLGAIALAALWFANPQNRSSVKLQSVLSQVLGDRPVRLPQAMEVAPSPAMQARLTPPTAHGRAASASDARSDEVVAWIAPASAPLANLASPQVAKSSDGSAGALLADQAPGADATGVEPQTVSRISVIRTLPQSAPALAARDLTPLEAAPAMSAVLAGRAIDVEDAVARLQERSEALGEVRIVLHAQRHPSGLQALLGHVGFKDAEAPESAFVAARTQVHYFDQRDADLAADLAIVLGGEAVNLTRLQRSAAVRRLDVFLAGTS